jgi:hypothetical protein
MSKTPRRISFFPASAAKISCLLGLLATAAGDRAARADETTAVGAADFLNSIGACVHVQHHQPAEKLVNPLKYAGVRTVRDGADKNYDVSGLILLHREAGVGVVFGPGSGAQEEDIAKTITACRELAAAGALLALEGPNEPNNFGGVTYQGKNSDQTKSWLPVAKFQQDYYQRAKSDFDLKRYPFFGISEVGAEDDDSGLQFLKIPAGAHTLVPDGTQFADFINCHNYVCGHIDGLVDNQPTQAASVHPTIAIDHLYGNHGLTWRNHFKGYSESELATIPKVTTETGFKSDDTPAGDDRQGKVLLNTYLAQYKAGWQRTYVYEFTDDSDGSFGFFKSDLTTPRPAADYLHNLTTILADTGARSSLSKVDYSIQNKPATVHDLLLQKSNGTFELVVWGEQVKGSNNIEVNLGGRYSVKVYDPTTGTAATATLNGTDSVPLTVSDHPFVLEFK